MYRLLRLLRPHREPDSGGGTGGTGGQQGDQGDDRQQLQGLLARHNNDAMAVVATLLTENHGLRDERRTLRGQLPAQGAVVLAPEQATAWQAYQQLGAAPDLQTALTEREQLQQRIATLQQDSTLRDVAALAKYDLEVLRTIGGDLSYVIKDETVNGKAEKKVFVKVKEGEAEKEIALDKHAEAAWAKFLPSLRLAPERIAIGTPPARTNSGQAQPGAAGTARKSTVRL